MWIVRLALRRPYTFVVMAVLIAILGGTAIVTMPVDIFPYIDIPIVSVLWVYQGLSPEEMEKRVVTGFERSLTSNVNDIEHIESQAYNGYAVVRVYFHPNVKIDMAVAQVTAISSADEARVSVPSMPGACRCRAARTWASLGHLSGSRTSSARAAAGARVSRARRASSRAGMAGESSQKAGNGEQGTGNGARVTQSEPQTPIRIPARLLQPASSLHFR